MYRVTITEANTTSKEQILLSCTFQHSDDGVTWADLTSAPESFTLPIAAIRDALKSNVTQEEKRLALVELIRTTARSLPALYGAVAIEAIEDLLPTGWPVTVNL